jgi:hypothetical protein
MHPTEPDKSAIEESPHDIVVQKHFWVKDNINKPMLISRTLAIFCF